MNNLRREKPQSKHDTRRYGYFGLNTFEEDSRVRVDMSGTGKSRTWVKIMGKDQHSLNSGRKNGREPWRLTPHQAFKS